MAVVDSQPIPDTPPLAGRPPAALALVVCLLAGGMTLVGIALLAAGKAEAALLAAAAPIVGLAILARPAASVYVVLALIYTNAPVVAMRHHGVPYVIAAAVPGLLLIPIGYYVLIQKQSLRIPAITGLIALFVAVQAMGTLLAEQPLVALDSLFISLTEGVALFLLLVNAIRDVPSLRWSVWALLAAGAFMGAVCAHQYATRAYEKDYGGFAQIQGKGFGVQGARTEVTQHRATGPLGVENRFAQIMLMLVPLALFRVWGEPHVAGRLLAAGALVLIGVGWALAFSRGSAVGLVLTVGIMTLMGCIRVRQAGFVAVGGVLLLLLLPQYRERLATLDALPGFISGKSSHGGAPDGAITGRATEMLAAARVFADYPIVGVGPGMFRYYAREYGMEGGLKALEGAREAHCLYLAILAEHGALGFACFMGILGVTLVDLFRLRRRALDEDPQLAHLLTGFLLMIVVYLTTGIFAHFSFIRYFWTMVALATAAILVARQRLEHAVPAPLPGRAH